MVKVLSIIVSYNFEHWLHKCIGSILNSTVPTDVMVIDNNSNDNTIHIIEEQYPSVQLVRNKVNLGFGQANNIALCKAAEMGYDYVFLVNQDAWIKEDCIEQLLKIYASDIGIVSPIHKDGTGKNIDKGFKEYIQHFRVEDNLKVVKFVNAAFWLIPVGVIKRVGYFSPIFYHYGEDKDFANRINFHGLKIVFVDDAIAFHDRQNRPFNRQAYLKSEFVYFLTEYCNINYSGFKAFLMSIVASVKKMMLSAFKGKFIYAKAYFIIIFKLLLMTPKVIKTRYLNKKTYPKMVQ